MFITGFFFWTIIEYVMHRFVFHGEEVYLNKLPWTRNTWTGHFLLHGIHHAFPQDRLRITFPVIPGIPVFYSFISGPYRYCLPSNMFPPFVCGLIFGYALYDCCHYYCHHGKPAKGSYWDDQKLYHVQHHYKEGTLAFGVSSKFFDYVFGTEVVDYKPKKD